MTDAMKLWDGLFACDTTFELAQWVCVAMLIRIRNQCDYVLPIYTIQTHDKIQTVIPADYSGQLTVLLRYPSPQSPAFEDAPHHTSLLLRQALALQMSPTPSTGVSLVIENRNMLNIPSEVPDPAPAPQRTRSQRLPTKGAAQSHPTHSASESHSRQPTLPQMGLPEMIARGLLERGESLGINKTLMSAVSELRVCSRVTLTVSLFDYDYSATSQIWLHRSSDRRMRHTLHSL